MISIRPALFVLASIGIVIGVASTEWTKVIRETRFDGSISQEHLILGRFKRSTDSAAPGIKASEPVKQKLSDYGLSPLQDQGLATLTIEGSRTQYSYSIDAKSDIRHEAKRLGKECKWLKIKWRGTRFTSFVAQGFHPVYKGHVSVYIAKLPERKYGTGMAHTLLSIQE